MAGLSRAAAPCRLSFFRGDFRLNLNLCTKCVVKFETVGPLREGPQGERCTRGCESQLTAVALRDLVSHFSGGKPQKQKDPLDVAENVRVVKMYYLRRTDGSPPFG